LPTLKEIAAFLDGRVIGDPEIVIERVCGIDEAGRGDLTFVANPKYRSRLATTGASAVLVAPGTEAAGKNLVWVADPYVAFGQALGFLHPEEKAAAGIHPRAMVEAEAVVSPEATVYPGVYVGQRARIDRGAVLFPGVFIGPDAVIGEDSVLHPGVTVYRRCLIGRRVTLHAGVVVGGDGFGFARPGWENRKIPQIGIVKIEDDVEIGANTTIDRATTEVTLIRRGAKIDNLVQIAHNVVVGEHSILAAQVGVSGSTQIGKNVTVAGQAGLVGHIHIGDNAMIGAQGGVTKSVPADTKVSGYPAREHSCARKIYALWARLPELFREVKNLAKRVEELEKRK